MDKTTKGEADSDNCQIEENIRMKTGLDYRKVCECDDVDCELNHKPGITFRSTKEPLKNPHKISLLTFNNRCKDCYLLKGFEGNKKNGNITIDCAAEECDVIVRYSD